MFMQMKSKWDARRNMKQPTNRCLDMDLHWPQHGLGGGLASPVPQIATWRSERPGAAEPSIAGRICGR